MTLRYCVVDRFVLHWLDQGPSPRLWGSVGSGHVRLQPPRADAPLHFNWKWFSSLPNQAVCDHQHQFLVVFTGFPGWVLVSRVLWNSPLYTGGDGGICLHFQACCPHESMQESRVDFHRSQVHPSSHQSLVCHWKDIQDYKVQMASSICQICICSKGCCPPTESNSMFQRQIPQIQFGLLIVLSVFWGCFFSIFFTQLITYQLIIIILSGHDFAEVAVFFIIWTLMWLIVWLILLVLA